ncbi:MAG: energy transducer TonB, partial [Rhodospirillales bacterium]|nr:energy transducer TonB [Rhodospirillales bacterium]
AQAATEDEVQVPDMPLTALPNPPPMPHPHPAPQRSHPRHAPPEQQKYVFLNGMNYGNVSPVAPPVPQAPRGMNFSLPTSDAQAATASDFSVKGDAGADWDAALTKWVQDHAYYPQAAAEQGQEGTATVEFTVDRNGHVTGLKLLDSAGSPFLDQAWEQLFSDNTLPRFPPDAKDSHVEVRYTVHYVLVH